MQSPRLPASDDLLERAGLTRPWVAAAIGAVLFAAIVLAVYVDYPSLFSSLVKDPDFWRRNLGNPGIIAYGLLAHHFLDNRTRKAVASFRPLVEVDDTVLDRLLASGPRRAFRFQVPVMVAVALLGLLPIRVWVWDNGFTWNALVIKAESIAVYALIGSYLYLAVTKHQLFTKLFRQPLSIDVFDMAPVRPIAYWGLAISLAPIGGITVSMLTLDRPEALLIPELLAVYSVLAAAAIAIFFASLFGIHQVMLHAKEKELSVVHGRILGIYRTLKSLPEDPLQEMPGLSTSVSSWLAYEKRIMEAPEWPYTLSILGGLFASMLLPMAATALQQLLMR